MRYFQLAALAVSFTCLHASAQPADYEDGAQCLAFIGVLEQAYGSTPEMAEASSGWRAYIDGVSDVTDATLEADTGAQSQIITRTMAEKSANPASVSEYLTSFAEKCQTPPPPPISDSVCYAVADSVRESMDFLVSVNRYNMTLQSGAEYEESREEMQKAQARLEEADAAVAHYNDAPKANSEELLMLLKATNEERNALMDSCIIQMQ